MTYDVEVLGSDTPLHPIHEGARDAVSTLTKYAIIAGVVAGVGYVVLGKKKSLKLLDKVL